MNEKIIKLRKKIKKVLDEHRYEHTLGVMYTAASMAMIFDVDLEKAMIAGLLHDCAKCISHEKKFAICDQYNVEVSEVEQSNPGLLHAKLGAVLAKVDYEIDDKDILHAIESHTTGRPHMTTLEKIIYIADYIEPGRRELPNFSIVRKLAFQNLDECLYVILKDSLVYLQSRNIPVDPMTENTYLYYCKVLNKGE